MSSTVESQLAADESLEPRCLHCGLELPSEKKTYDFEASRFCCSGCQFVYQIIKENNLSGFYDLRAKTAMEPFKPNVKHTSFSYMNAPEFIETHVKVDQTGLATITFLLEGIHCAACVWLLEKLPSLNSGITEARVDFARMLLTVTYDSKTIPASEVAALVNSLGYPPSPAGTSNAKQIRQREERKLLLRIGVAGLAAGNTMLLAVSLYQGMFTGIPEQYGNFLRWVSLLLTLPVVTFCAYPFYRATLAGFRARILHIDLPISLGILAGFAASAVNTLRANENVYFDSVCMLVFLLLAGRWFQMKGLRQSIEASELLPSLLPLNVIRIANGSLQETYLGSIASGDDIQVEPGTVIPVDGVLFEGSSAIDMSVLTGESRPVKVAVGEKVFAGTRNISSTIKIKTEMVGSDSRIGKLMQIVEQAAHRKTRLVQITDRISGFFVAGVLLLAGCNLIWWLPSGFSEAFNHTLALIVVTCPCALGLAAPVTLSVAIARAARQGILVRSAQALESAARCRRIFFDKTGTLTAGKMEVVRFLAADASQSGFLELAKESALSTEQLDLYSVILRLESRIEHPIARSLVNFLQAQSDLEPSPQFDIEAIEYHPGKGVQATDLSGTLWQIGSPAWTMPSKPGSTASAADTELSTILNANLTPVVVLRNSRIAALIGIGDAIRDEAQFVVDRLGADRKQLSIISGDNQEITQSLAAKLGIAPDFVYAEASPESKQKIVQESQAQEETAMIGDGVNDSAALQAAGVGIAIQGGAEASLATADIYLSKQSLESVLRFFQGSQRTISVIRRNLIFSVVYNLAGATAAILGYMHPLAAALLMPASSLTVVLSSTLSRTFTERLE